nr:immunoglobulin light chain junction region [Macaca mulatta]MOV70236.1 immunoglobulin light chain junction region [Macaca mulatta]
DYYCSSWESSLNWVL